MTMIPSTAGSVLHENAAFSLSQYEQKDFCPLLEQFAHFKAKWLDDREECSLDVALKCIQETGASLDGVYRILSDHSIDLKMMEEEFGKRLCHIFFEKASLDASPEERAAHIANMRKQLSDPLYYQGFFSLGESAFLHFLEERCEDWFEMGLAFSFDLVPYSLAQHASVLKERAFFQTFAKVQELRRLFYLHEMIKEYGYFPFHPKWGNQDWLKEGTPCSFKEAIKILAADPTRTKERFIQLSRSVREVCQWPVNHPLVRQWL